MPTRRNNNTNSGRLRRRRQVRPARTVVGRINQSTGITRQESTTNSQRRTWRGNARSALTPLQRIENLTGTRDAKGNYIGQRRYDTLDQVQAKHRNGAVPIYGNRGQVVGYMANYTS